MAKKQARMKHRDEKHRRHRNKGLKRKVVDGLSASSKERKYRLITSKIKKREKEHQRNNTERDEEQDFLNDNEKHLPSEP